MRGFPPLNSELKNVLQTLEVLLFYGSNAIKFTVAYGISGLFPKVLKVNLWAHEDVRYLDI